MTTEWNRPAGGLSLDARLLLGALIPAAALILLFLNLWAPGATPTRPAPAPPVPAVTRQMEMEGAAAHGLTPPTAAQDFAGIDRPPALPAAQAGLADDEK